MHKRRFISAEHDADIKLLLCQAYQVLQNGSRVRYSRRKQETCRHLTPIGLLNVDARRRHIAQSVGNPGEMLVDGPEQAEQLVLTHDNLSSRTPRFTAQAEEIE
jgi:hypothetical protein